MFTHFRSDFLKNLLTLVSGTGIAQAISLLSAPIVARYFSPEDFTIFALFNSTAAILSVIATARYELAVPLPAKDEESKSILLLSVLVNLFVSCLSFLLIAIFLQINNGFEAAIWFYLLPVSVMATGCYNAFNYWSTRKKTFQLNALARITMAAATSGISIFIGFWNGETYGLILGLIVGQILGAMLLMWPWISAGRIFFSGITLNTAKKQAQKHVSFLKVNTPHALIDTLQDHGVVYVLTYFFIEAVTGWYTFAFRIIKAPVGLIGSAFYQLFYQKLAEAKNAGKNLQPLVLQMYWRLAIIGVPFFGLFFVFAPQLFEFVFGPRWSEAGKIAQILTPWICLNFILSPVSSITLVCNRQKAAFAITLVDSSVRLFALVIGGIFNNYTLSFIIISASCSFVMIFGLWWYYVIAGNPFNKVHAA